MKKMAAGEFKSKCLAIMDEVEQTGESALVTKRGKPVAKVIAVRQQGEDVFGYMEGKAKIIGDVIHSAPLEDWNLE